MESEAILGALNLLLAKQAFKCKLLLPTLALSLCTACLEFIRPYSGSNINANRFIMQIDFDKMVLLSKLLNFLIVTFKHNF
jgi:hypothetical protein